MRVVVTGGRDFHQHTELFQVLDALHRIHGIDLVGHGGASGADRLAGTWARVNKVPEVTYPAEWGKYGRYAGPRRNRVMLDNVIPDLVVAFRGGRGTADCVKAAEDRGIRVQRVGWPNGLSLP